MGDEEAREGRGWIVDAQRRGFTEGERRKRGVEVGVNESGEADGFHEHPRPATWRRDIQRLSTMKTLEQALAVE